MSANRQRIASAVRSLALTPEERRALLGEGQNKGGKASSAGVGTSEAEESRLCCDGSTSSSANPGTAERDPDADEAGQGGLDSSDPAKLSSGDGTLSGVTDCATGEPICFDGAGFIPPDEWDGPSQPPTDPDFVQGCRWYHSSTTEEDNYATPDQAFYASDVFASQGDYCYKRKDGDSSSCAGVSYTYRTSNENGCVVGAGVARSVAGVTPEDEIPRADSWPSDGCTNLAIVNGQIVGSKYDPDQDGSYSAPRDSIDLCDPENGARITLRASGQSNWKTIDAINGGDGYLYSGGKQIARVSGDEFTDPNV
ncbi:hypothetical protein [Halomonas rhizosphaerae]|uniref:Uncharacterized protein n=1 Tax=Halomonas rhizosphaerae TaxID=3043296 RepID=A0ABT6UX94_9GAMM|nr:hypothetical protein [Halomonas rhizosphaerae]MDI5890590.1 hypothetical protein [Halomonas rhizosphaerae]